MLPDLQQLEDEYPMQGISTFSGDAGETEVPQSLKTLTEE